ncbi:dihydroxyacetone kinase subunit L [Cryobacterium suzukii]|uniref:Dihydroxyacetone kinase subunit L n=1 Tax=Cryobacterium suzukii TaxID=1259198 RepID=A0A4R9ADB4_9MICO|nr:dihydroxyacetone kinase subunit DhaL [Cryobacterium suzukii]TFD57771.1 dihydroxyacetone kinase subunit L [Cryobacterium suzukii]
MTPNDEPGAVVSDADLPSAAPRLDTGWTIRWIRLSADVLAANRAALNTLDRDIGDGDHGENMDRGFQAILPKLDGLDDETTPGSVLKIVATTLISTVGGAAGPLYGTAFLKAAGAVGTTQSLDATALVALLTAARDGIVLRGKAAEGDKTMVDAWTPAVNAASAAQTAGSPVGAVLLAAADAAAQGAQATEPLVARKGRASYLGERAIGHRDPGSQSTSLLLRAAADVMAQH